MNINPDSGINVVAIYPDGLAKVYDSLGETGTKRKYLYARKFSNYGKAYLFAALFEEQGRREKLLRGR